MAARKKENQTQSNKAQGNKNFAKLWDASPEEFQKKIDRNEKMVLTSVGLACAFNAAKFAMPPTPVRKISAVALFSASQIIKAQTNKLQEQIDKKQGIFEDDEKTSPVAEEIQDMAERLFKKAELAYEPVVLMSTSPWGISTLTDDENGKAHIKIGALSLMHWTEEETAAALAWEAANLMTEKPKDSVKILRENKLYTLTTAFSTTAMSRGFKPWAAMFGRNASFGVPIFLLGKSSQRAGVMRTDRNAIGLFPHPEALKEVLYKDANRLHCNIKPPKGPDNKPLKAVWQTCQNKPSLEQRLTAIDEYYQEAVDFYQEHGLVIDTDEIMGVKAPEQNEKPRQNKKPSGPGNNR